MKLVIAIINNDDSHKVLSQIGRAGFYATKLSTTGGFLKAGNMTLIMGVEDERLDELLALLKENCKRREEMTTALPDYASDMMTAVPVRITVGGATVFVLDVDKFIKL